MKRNRNISLFDKSLLRQSLHASFVKLDPRKMIKSPIMFTVEVVTFVMLLLLVYIAVTGDRSQGSFAYNFVVFVVLFLTVLFANFAEAIAEARGKAQAIKERRRDTSIKTRRTTGPAIKERGAAVSIKGQAAKPPVSKPASGIKSPRARTARTRLSSGAAKQARRHIEQQGRQFAAKKAAKATAQKTGQVSKKAGTAIVRAGKTAVASLAKGIGAVLAAGGGGILLVVLLFIGAIAAIASSPFGIFFANDSNSLALS